MPVANIVTHFQVMSVAPTKSRRGRKAEKGTERFKFWSPESTEKREKKTRRNFLYLRVRQERSAQIAPICIQNKASLKIDFVRWGLLILSLVILTRKRASRLR